MGKLCRFSRNFFQKFIWHVGLSLKLEVVQIECFFLIFEKLLENNFNKKTFSANLQKVPGDPLKSAGSRLKMMGYFFRPNFSIFYTKIFSFFTPIFYYTKNVAFFTPIFLKPKFLHFLQQKLVLFYSIFSHQM